MRFISAFVLGILSFATLSHAHPGHAEHMITPSLWHALSDPMHLLFLGGIIAIAAVAFARFSVLKRK